MKRFSLQEIKDVQTRGHFLRNVCILAHVDHGKTTLADALVASNGIISKRLAGKLRYLDSRRDEQERGITMKSSSISLGHSLGDDKYLVNLIDSPGHVDFCGEVSAAIRLCDGALVVVDVVEGVCSQTKTGLKQAFLENIKPILVLNKIDRLILERKFSPFDAFIHLQQILEQVNAFMGELFTTGVFSDIFSESCKNLAKVEEESEGSLSTAGDNEEFTYDWNNELDDKDDSTFYFAPEQGNVVFASAVDGWGFSVQDFSQFLALKMGIKEAVINKTLWGDYYLDSKRKRIMKGAQSKAKKPLFVTMVLENIWSVYEAIVVRRDKVRLEKIVSSLSLEIPKRDLNHGDCKVQLQAVFGQWLPLSSTLLNAICKLIPSPLHLTEDRAKRLMCSNMRRFESLPHQTRLLKDAFVNCSSDDKVPKIICVSKMFAVDKQSMPENKARPLTCEEIVERREQAKIKLNEKSLLLATSGSESGAEPMISASDSTETESNVVTKEVEESKETFIAFARVFSGTLRKGDILYVLGPKHNPSKMTEDTIVDPSLKLVDLPFDKHATVATVESLYILMGRELEVLEEVGAGNVVGIRGLQDHVLKSATLSDSLYCPSFIDLHVPAQPILRVALEPQNPAEMPQLVRGLKLLNQADPGVEVKIQDTGEHVIVTTGEVHLQKCVDDLTQSFAGIRINVSEPIVPFKETIVLPPKVDMVNEAIDEKNFVTQTDLIAGWNKATEIFTPNKKSCIKLKAIPLPEELAKLLESESDLLKSITSVKESVKNELTDETLEAISVLKEKLRKLFVDAGNPWDRETVDKIWSFGPKYCGPNILLNLMPNFMRHSIWDPTTVSDKTKATGLSSLLYMFDNSFVSGFQLATLSGPLCDEPMMGVCFVVEEWLIESEMRDMTNDSYGPFSGQIMSTVKEGCRRTFQAQPQRLRMAMYSCTIQVTSEALGKMYAVLGRRHGRVIDGDLEEGSQTFTVNAVLPVIESFALGNEIRKQTSGLASPQLVFSHWETLDVDPFWVPSTEEEYALFGEKADTENRARKYMNQVRRRKGLPVDEKIVEHAEKQRTLTRNK